MSKMSDTKSTQYSEKVLEHFRNPRNVGVIEKPSGYGKVGNPVCGDLMEIYIKVEKDKAGEDVIDEVKFRTFGCGSAVATSSMVTTMAKGMKVDDAYKITRNDVAEELDGLPPIKRAIILMIRLLRPQTRSGNKNVAIQERRKTTG